jgi:hypothetical protein
LIVAIGFGFLIVWDYWKRFHWARVLVQAARLCWSVWLLIGWKRFHLWGLVCWSFPLVLEALPLHRVKRARKPSKAAIVDLPPIFL